MQFGVYTFVETERDPATGRPINVERTLAETMAEIELADRVGLDVFALGEHLMQMRVGAMPHAAIMRSIELFGTVVAPAVRQALA